MAEGVLYDITEKILEELGSQLLQEVGLVCGAKSELKKLKKTVSTIKAVLLDAEEQQAKTHGVKEWIAELKDAVHYADDLLDDFSAEALQREVIDFE